MHYGTVSAVTMAMSTHPDTIDWGIRHRCIKKLRV